MYTNGATAPTFAINLGVAKSFGGTVYISSTRTLAQGNNFNSAIGTTTSPTATSLTGLTGVAIDAAIVDFYLVQSGSNGSAYDILYKLDGGTITKYSLVTGSWVSNGTYSLSPAGLSLIAANNGSGANIYYTTSTTVVQIADTTGWVNSTTASTTNFTVTVANNKTLYTASGGTGDVFLKGIAFVSSASKVPTVTSPTKTGVGINTATLGGTITVTGGEGVTAYGAVYSTSNTTPTVGGNGCTSTPGTASATIGAAFTIPVTGLQGTSTYYYAAYATNSVGTGYSSVDTFTTQNANPPTIDTPTDTSVTDTSAILGGTVESNGGATITKTGVVYALTTPAAPQIGGTGVMELDTTNPVTNGAFTISASGLTAGTSYTFEAFAINSSGTTYTAPTTFTTLAAPTVNVPTFAGVTSDSATLGATVATNGGSTVIKSGIVYAKNSDNATLAIGNQNVTEVDTTNPVDSGAFTVQATSLSASTGYTFKAFAINSIGTTYSAATQFSTAAPGIIASWTFPALAGPPFNSPAPTYGTGTATTLGMTNSYNGGNVAGDDVIVTAGTANPNFRENTWRIRGTGNNGWATFQNGAGAPQYSQGIQLDTSTVGYSNIVFSFDWYSTTQGIRDLQVQYNTGSGWVNYQGPSATGTFIATSNDYYNSNLSPVSPTIYIDLSGVAAANNVRTSAFAWCRRSIQRAHSPASMPAPPARRALLLSTIIVRATGASKI